VRSPSDIRFELTARRAGMIIAGFTLGIGVASGVLMTVLDREDFPNVGLGLWWAVQTVTTVGYGDKVPTNTEGRIVAAIVMIVGLGFLSVITATITAVFIESARRKQRAEGDVRMADLAERLERIERQLDELSARRP
jgi:voltage-gated potassium channel